MRDPVRKTRKKHRHTLFYIVKITIIFVNIAFIISINFAEKVCKNHSYDELVTISPRLNTVQRASLSPEHCMMNVTSISDHDVLYKGRFYPSNTS